MSYNFVSLFICSIHLSYTIQQFKTNAHKNTTVRKQIRLHKRSLNNDYAFLSNCFFFPSYRKAIKFYILDICVNPDRLDSWAGMSLARMSRLEQKLNSVSMLKLFSTFLCEICLYRNR